MAKSTELTVVQSQVVAIVCELSQRTGNGIGYRDIIRELALAKCREDGIATPTDEDIAERSCAINAITGHIKAIAKKTGKTVITWEDMPSGAIKPNTLRSANMAATQRTQDSPYCRNGIGWSIVVVGDEVAFTIFSEMGIVKHDKMPLNAVLTYCDQSKIPADLAVIDRVSLLAEKNAKLAAAKAVKVTA